MSNPVDLSSLPEEERQELQKLQERFEEHQQQQQQKQQHIPNHQSPYGPSQVEGQLPPYQYQPYYGYYPYPAPEQSSLQHPPPFPPPDHHQQHYYQDHQLQQHQYPYYHTEHANAYQEHFLHQPDPHPQLLPSQIGPIPHPHPHPSGHLVNFPPQPQPQHLAPPGQVQVHHQQNVYYPQIGRSDGDQQQPAPLNPAAAAAVAALSQLMQFAGTMGDAERALAMIGLQASGIAGHGSFMGPSVVGPQLPQDPGSFMPMTGQSMYMRGDTRGGGLSFPNKPHGKIRQRNGKGKIGPKLPLQPSVSEPTGTASNKLQTPAAWCELCCVECTSLEILKQHKIGKRHMKNLEKAGTSSAVVQNNQNNNTADAIAPTTIAPNTATIDGETANAQVQANEENNNNKPAETTNSLVGQKREPSRKTKGGKRAKLSDAQRRTFENPKPKVVVPLSCGLCNIKCDTQEVLNKHLAGKKHISKLRRYESHPQVGYDQTGIQPLYHPIGPHPPLHFPQAHLHHQQPHYLPAASAILPFAEGNQNHQLG